MYESETKAYYDLFDSLKQFVDSFDGTIVDEKMELAQKVVQMRSLELLLNTRCIKIMGLNKVCQDTIQGKELKLSYEWEKAFDDITSKVQDDYIRNQWADLLTIK